MKDKSLRLRDLPEREQEILKCERERIEKLPPAWKSCQKGWDVWNRQR